MRAADVYPQEGMRAMYVEVSWQRIMSLRREARGFNHVSNKSFYAYSAWF